MGFSGEPAEGSFEPSPRFRLLCGSMNVGWVLLSMTLGASPVQDPPDAARERAKLVERGEEILRQTQENEITLVTARRRVQLLLKDLKKWAETHELELKPHTRTYSSPSVGVNEDLTADRCPLFYEEDLEHFCPLDLSRSEVWGTMVVFCRYWCAPEPGDDSSPDPRP